LTTLLQKDIIKNKGLVVDNSKKSMKEKTKKENKKLIRVSEADYQTMRRDKKSKKEIRGLVLMLHDKVKNWK
jgi:hypothetical protein